MIKINEAHKPSTKRHLHFTKLTRKLLSLALGPLIGLAPNSSILANMLVSVVQPQTGTLTQTLPLAATVVPRHEVLVASELTGRKLNQILVEQGDQVTAGQVVAILEASDLNYEVTRLKALYDQAKFSYENSQEIAKKNNQVLSEEELNNKLQAYLAAEADYKRGQLELDKTKLKALVAGLVYEKTAVVGQIVQANQSLLKIAQDGELELQAWAPVAYKQQIYQLQLDRQKFDMQPLTANNLPTIRLIAPAINPQNQSIELRIKMDGLMPGSLRLGKQPNEVNIGETFTIELQLAQKYGQILPITSLVSSFSSSNKFNSSIANSSGSNTPSLTTGIIYLAEPVADAASSQLYKVTSTEIPIALQTTDRILTHNLPSEALVITKAGNLVTQGDLVNINQQ